jgi:phage I-like protein
MTMGRYLVTEEDGTGHLPVRDTDGGPLNHHLIGAAWAALHGGYRGNKYHGPDKEKAIAKLKALYKGEGMPLPPEQQNSDVGAAVAAATHPGQAQGAAPTGRIAVLLAGPGTQVGDRYEIPICVTGTWVKNSHKFSITTEDLANMVRNFNKRKNAQVVIDYEHASEQPEVARGGAIPAAGWIHALTLTPALSTLTPDPSPSGRGGTRRAGEGAAVGEGTLFARVEWTPEAQRLIQGGQYRFFSPAIDWNFVDKETGKSQGATLTSGALTNHPFLEELPPITLTESGVVLADVSTGYLDAPAGSADRDVRSAAVKSKTADAEAASALRNGGKMASKRLSIKKIKGDDFDGDEFKGAVGHHGIFDGEEFVGHVHADDMKGHLKSCRDEGFGDLDDLTGGPQDETPLKGQAGLPGHQTASEKLSELLRESGFEASADADSASAIRAALKLAATHQLLEQREASRNLILSECMRPSPSVGAVPPLPGGEGQGLKGVFNTDRAKLLLQDNKINAADLLDAIEAKSMIDNAVAKGKVLPKDRAFFFEIAFNHPKKFIDYVAGAVPVVAFGSVGIGSTENMPVDQEVDIEAKKLMSEKNIGYGKAMKELFKVNPALEQRYRAAHRTEPRRDAPIDGLTQ